MYRAILTDWNHGVSCTHTSLLVWGFENLGPWFFDAFVKLRKATISFDMFVCPSICPHGTTRLPLDGFSWILVFEHFFFETLSRKSQVSLKSDENNGRSHEDLRACMISRWIIFRMRNVSEKFVEKIKTHILRLVTFFPKIVPFMIQCGKIW